MTKHAIRVRVSTVARSRDPRRPRSVAHAFWDAAVFARSLTPSRSLAAGSSVARHSFAALGALPLPPDASLPFREA